METNKDEEIKVLSHEEWPGFRKGFLITFALLSGGPLLADRVITEDGRIVTPAKARKEGEQRWDKQQTQVRKDIAALLRRMEKAVDPPKKRTRKAPRKKAAAGATG